jgi:streptogramin lyase
MESNSSHVFERLESRQLLSVQTFTPPTASNALQSETVGRDGSLYFVEADQQQIGRILPSGDIVEYAVPDNFGDIGQLTTAKDGSIWFNTFNADSPLLGHLTTKGRITSVAINNDAISIGAANDGTVWFSSVEDGIGRVSKNRVSYLGGTGPANYVTKILSGPTGSIYFMEVAHSSDPTTTPYVLSVQQVTRNLKFTTLFSGNTPLNFDNITDIAAAVDTANNLALGSDGTIWCYDGNQLIGITPGTNVLTQRYVASVRRFSSLTGGPFPAGSPFFVDHTDGGSVWPTLSAESYDLPAGAGAPYAVISGGNNTLWVTDETQGLIYKITLADYVSETDAVGLAGNSYPILNHRHVVGSKIHLTFNNTSTLYDTIQVLRSSSANGRYSLIGSVSGGTGLLSFDDTNVKLSTSYFYKIRSTVFNAYLGGPLEITHYYNAPF